jgi:beta propeller repeat protein
MALAGVERVTDTPYHETAVRVSGDYLVYVASTGSGGDPENSEIYIHRLSTGLPTRLTDDGVRQYQASISGDQVVWTDYRWVTVGWDYDVFGYDIGTSWLGPVSHEAGAQYQPSVSGNRVVWVDNRDIWHYLIYTKDPDTGIQHPVSPRPGDQWLPEISGDRVVWQDQTDDAGDIYLYDFSTGIETPICVAPEAQRAPDIDGDLIVWEDNRTGTSTIWFYDLSNSTTGPVFPQSAPQYAPRVSGSLVVWAKSSSIYRYDFTTGLLKKLNQGPGEALYPDIDSETVVWQDYSDGNWNIYKYVNLPPVLDPIGDKAVVEGGTLSFTVTATEPDSDPVTFSATGLPSGASFDPATCTFSWTPGLGQAGSYPGVRFTVTDDGGLTDYEEITITVLPVPPVGVQVDIKPGSYPNSVNLGSQGLIPVGIFSSASFDATQIDPVTVTLAGAGVAVKGKGTYLAKPEDLNGDGRLDMVIHVYTQNLDPGQFDNGYGQVSGATYGGQHFQGWDEIRIVPPS